MCYPHNCKPTPVRPCTYQKRDNTALFCPCVYHGQHKAHIAILRFLVVFLAMIAACIAQSCLRKH